MERDMKKHDARLPGDLGYHFLRRNYPGFPHSHYERTAAFGFKHTSPVPKDAEGVVTVGGIELRLTRPPVAGRSKHRILARCPCCLREVPAGRLHQHVGVCAVRAATA
jgi:hypothetical protein